MPVRRIAIATLSLLLLDIGAAEARRHPPRQPCIGCVAVWHHHVGVITGFDGRDWIVHSGNDGGAVRTRARSLAGAVFRSS